MGDLLLSSDSILMCPHGGLITHIPTTTTTYRISGRLPMLMTDVYVIAGCPFYAGAPSPCVSVQWVTASAKLIVKGIPVLTLTSVGLCMGVNGAPQGPVIVAAHQLGIREPDEYTNIDY